MEYIGILIKLQKWVNLFAGYILWLLMVYLTDVWELELIHAAGIVNIWMGFIKILPIVFAYFADAFLGNSFIVLFSSFSSMIGLGLIWMSTPPVLGKSNGNCTQYKAECIGEQQKQLFYSGLVFTALGMASLSACYAPFAQEQAEETASTNTRTSGYCRTHMVAFAALLIAAFVKPWAILFGICAILGAVSFLVCLILRVCLGFGNPVPRPQGSPLTTVFRVIFAATSKSFCSRPQDSNELYESSDSSQELLPHTKGLRCLDKAAIIEAKPELEQQERKKWSLCKVTEVEETKIFIGTIPIWMTFIVSGIVSSLCATYFLEQANHLDRRVGKAKAPLILFFWFYDHFRKSFTVGFMPAVNNISRHYMPRIGVAAALMYATLSCIAAAKIETRRLGVVTSHDLIDKPHERVPMTVFWLLFQFILLGCHDGIHRLSAYGISLDRAPKSMVKYFNLFSRGFFGLGVMGSVVLVEIVGKISEGRTGASWFQSTLNTSRIDNYYWVLASLSSVNLVIFIIVACFSRYRAPRDGLLLSEWLLPSGFMDDDHI